jgi:hypothetical protein
MKKHCPVCKKEKDITLFRKRSKSKTGYDYICKVCHSEKQKERWHSKSNKEKTAISKQLYKKHRLKLATATLEEQISYWASKILSRHQCLTTKASKKSSERFKTRENLSKGFLVMKAKEALQIFPYLSFFNTRGDGNEMAYASLDRIDSNKPYSEENVRVIPLWLNSAKLNGEQSTLDSYIKEYHERFLK